ncbi:hypothetical protein ACOSQ3_004669 [Xanthoceras sorbifolium]
MENENIEPPIKHRKIRRPKKIGAKKFSAKCHNCSGLGHNKRTCTLQQPTAKGKGSIGGVSQRKSTQTTKQPRNLKLCFHVVANFVATLALAVERGAGPVGVRSLGVLGDGGGVFDAAGCDGGMCVGEGRVLVPTAGGAVSDPGSDRAVDAVLLGPDVGSIVVSGGLCISEREVVGPVAGKGLVGASFGRGLLRAAGCATASGGESAFSAGSGVLSSTVG